MTATRNDEVARLRAANAELLQRLDGALAERDEGEAQKAAMAEVLEVINASPGDLIPVFDAILDKAIRLCDAAYGHFRTYDGERFPLVSVRGDPQTVELMQNHASLVPAPYHPAARFMQGEDVIHFADAAQTDFYREDARFRGLVDNGACRAMLALALRKDRALLGYITVYRNVSGAFSDKQIALLQNFAAQAVVAMENARLITETREALEQQTATAEVLQVINSSPGDLGPVFDTILEKAHSLCGASQGLLFLSDGDQFRPVAMRGVPEPFAERLRRGLRGSDALSSQPLLAGERFVHIADMAAHEHPRALASVELGGVRTLLSVPLRKDAVLLGMIVAARSEVRPFTDNQIALLQNFATQAVIAIENARLITETREALDQQTATAEVLQVINSSPGDLAPVFEAMLERAVHLCEFDFSTLWTYDGSVFRPVARHGVSELFWDYLQDHTPPAITHMVGGGPLLHIADLRETPIYQSDFARDTRKLGLDDVRTLVVVSLRKDDALLGVIAAYRREVRPFSEKQIALLQNFATQAVIAIENTRLITETREALDQQTATAEVLGVINSSPGDLGPVFDAVLDKALRLCEAAFGILLTFDGKTLRTVAFRNVPEALAQYMGQPLLPDPETTLGRVVRGRRTVHTEDNAASEPYRNRAPLAVAAVELGRARTVLHVPLIRDEIVLGVVIIFRQEVRSFTNKQIGLLENFAAQAVIAMENARLINETREALDQQTATAEVLQVINSSPGDLAPVFEAMVERAMQLCEADEAAVRTFDGEWLHLVAAYGEPGAFDRLQQLGPSSPDGLYGSLAHGEWVTHIIDVRETETFRHNERARERLELRNIRSWLAVALQKDGVLLGVINVHRHAVRPFSQKQIALLQNFAAQAVVAMENARLITETREALDQQTATAEVLGVINSSPGDLAPVFDAMLEKATRLCTAPYGQLAIYDGEVFRFVAAHGEAPFAAELSREPHPTSHGVTWLRIIDGENVVHIPDVRDTDLYRSGHLQTRQFVENGGGRSLLSVGLRKDNLLLGVLSIYRQEPRPFSIKEIALLENFAAQAVIAMENARLITETREALDQQTATTELLQVINSSPGDLGPVFDTMLEKAMRLCEAAFGSLWTNSGDRFLPIAHHGVPAPYAEYLAREVPAAGAGTGRARLLAGEPFAHIADLANEEPYRAGEPHRRALVDLGGARSALLVPLRKDEAVIGFIMIYRQEVQPFTDKQIALLQNFAAQAVIAIENARLITETREALEQQTATAEVLQVINSSPGDLTPVFDAILEKAHSLCGSSHGSLFLSDGEHFSPVAMRGVPERFAERLRFGFRGSEALASQPLLAGERFVHIVDMAEIDHPMARTAVELAGARTLLSVPLRKGDELLGIIVATRFEVRPFTEKEIALLENFAAQAVIAIENARLITETREALDQQTATAEVLQVINSSPGDLTPVFDAILEKAHSLCGAAKGALTTYDGEYFRSVATRGVSGEYAAMLRASHHNSRGSPPQRLLNGESLVHVPDMSVLPFPMTTAAAELEGARTALYVPLRKDGALLGYLTAFRHEVRPFTDKQIALLENFAAQAVIAIENARLITETREALEQQTATAEVLQVINSSPGELGPVFDAILEKAHVLCGTPLGSLVVREGGHLRAVATRGYPQEYDALARQGFPLGVSTTVDRLLNPTERWVQVDDVAAAIPDNESSVRRAAREIAGFRTALWVPLRKDGYLLGYISAQRQEVRPFTGKQIGLLENFAAQAVIAMENARLINETREALDQQTATAEVLGVINSSPGDLAPVFDAILEKAHALCGATFGSLQTYDGEFFRTVASRGLPDTLLELLREPFRPDPNSFEERLVRGDDLVHIPDVTPLGHLPDDPLSRTAVETVGLRTLLLLPLRKEAALVGYVASARSEVRPFTEKQIALLQSFAAQAVIAMENARLLDEVRQRQQELRVTFDNMADGVVMFDEALRLAAWNRNFQELLDLPDAALADRPSYANYLRVLAERGEFGTDDIEAELNRRLENADQELRLERTRPDGRVIEVRRNSVPDGGFVLIYSDITERKRSEEEIRAARDTAEATLRDLRAAQANLIQAEKMASLGQLTAGIAHEIKNPLNFVNNFASLSVELLDELKETTASAISSLDKDKQAEVDETMVMLTGNLEKIAEHGKRADNIVKSMLEHSRGVSGERREVDINGLIEEALNLAYHGARAQDQTFNITLERNYAESLMPIEVAPQEITRVFLNLFGNGFYAANKRSHEKGNGSFRPALTVTTHDNGEAVEVRVRDNGTGIPAEIKDRLFQPFFTTKPTGEGTGLGLSISYDIVTQQHGGTITVESEPGSYTEFTVRLPRH